MDDKPCSTGLERPVEISLDVSTYLDRGAAIVGAKSTDEGADSTIIWRPYKMKELAQIFLKQVKRKTAKQEDTDREKEQEEGGANSQQPQDTHTQPATHTTQTPPTAQTPSTSPIPSKAVSHNQSDTFVEKLLDEGWNDIALNISTHLEHSTTAYVIDTGGQPEFHAVLPLLLRGPALYLLFFNLAESLDECYNVKYTMRDGTTLSGASTYTSSYSTLHTLSQLLNSFASNRGTGAKRDLLPIAVLLATHLDLVTEETLKEVDEKLREVFSPDDLEKVSHLVHDAKETGFDSIFAPVNNKDGTGIEAVQRFLLSVIRVMCPKPVPVAILWLLFHFILRFHYEEQHVCSFDDCVELAMELRHRKAARSQSAQLHSSQSGYNPLLRRHTHSESPRDLQSRDPLQVHLSIDM